MSLQATIQRVLEHLAYRGVPGLEVKPRRHLLTLNMAMKAAEQEPLILKYLPCLIALNKSSLNHLERDLKKNPDLKIAVNLLKSGRNKKDFNFRGVPTSELHHNLLKLQSIHKKKENNKKTRVISIAISPEVQRKMQILSKLNKTNASKIFREKIEEDYEKIKPAPEEDDFDFLKEIEKI